MTAHTAVARAPRGKGLKSRKAKLRKARLSRLQRARFVNPATGSDTARPTS